MSDSSDSEQFVSKPKSAVSKAKSSSSKSSEHSNTVFESDRNIVVEDDDADNYGAESNAVEQTFADFGLCPELIAATKALGWEKPSIIQQKALPVALQGHDIIGLAETGSGKTGAFALPVIQALLAQPQPLFGLVLSPTRELAFQITETFENLGQEIGLRVVTLVGGVSEFDQARALMANPHIIVGTPGRALYHLTTTKGFSLKNLQYLILDEADRLLNMDFEKDINQILTYLPKERRSMLFSATMTSKVNKLQRASLLNPVKIEVSKKYQTAQNLQQQVVVCPAMYKELYLAYCLTSLRGKTSIIFTATCDFSQRLSITLNSLGFNSVPLHGQMNQRERLTSLAQFKTGKVSMLIATDVAARGLDIPSVDLVINYQVPNHSKDYIHRVGRTARAGRSGTAILFITQYDIEALQRIESLLGYKLEQWKIEKSHVMMLKQRVDEANAVASARMKEVARANKESGNNNKNKKGGSQKHR